MARSNEESFLELPEDLILHIIENHLCTWKNLVALDSAVCNKRLRPLLHSCLQNKSLSLGSVPYNTSAIIFMQQRGITTTAVSVDFQSSPDDSLSMIDLTKIESLSFSLPDDISCDLVDRIISCCPNLRKLKIAKMGYLARPESMPFFRRTGETNLKNLQTLKLLYLQSFNDFDLLFIASRSPHLKKLTIHNCSCISANGILVALMKWKHIQVLSTSRIEPIQFEPLLIPPVSTLDDSSTLKQIILHDVFVPNEYLQYLIKQHAHTITEFVVPCLRLNARELLSLCKSLPHLEKIDIRCCLYISPKDALQALANCPKLRSIRLNAICTDITLRPFADMAVWKDFVQRVPHLSSIHFGNLIKLSDDIIELFCDSYGETLCYLSILNTNYVTNRCLRYFHNTPNAMEEENDLVKNRRSHLKKRKHLIVSEVPNITDQMLKNIHFNGEWCIISDIFPPILLNN